MAVRSEIRSIAAEYLLTRIEREGAFSNIVLAELAQDKSISPEEFRAAALGARRA